MPLVLYRPWSSGNHFFPLLPRTKCSKPTIDRVLALLSRKLFSTMQILLMSQITHSDDLISFNPPGTKTTGQKTNKITRKTRVGLRLWIESSELQSLLPTLKWNALPSVSLPRSVSHMEPARNYTNNSIWTILSSRTQSWHNYLVLKNTWNTIWCGILGSLSARLFFATYLAEQLHSVKQQGWAIKRLT